MKILIASTPATGHLNPLLAIGRILVAEGHEVSFLSGSALRSRTEVIGAKFHAFPADADFDLRDFDSVVPELKSMPPGPDWLRVGMERIFVDTIPAQHKGLQQVLRHLAADVVIGDDMLFGVLPMLLGPRSDRPPLFFAAHRFCTGIVKMGLRILSACHPQPRRSSATTTPRSIVNMTGSFISQWPIA
jgi:hypothetical protein